MDKPGRGIKSVDRDTPINKGESDDDQTLLENEVEDEAANIPGYDHKELQRRLMMMSASSRPAWPSQ
jgi:hypothetical protein